MNKIITISSSEASASLCLSSGCLTHYSFNRTPENSFNVLRPFTAQSDENIDPLKTSSFPLIPYSNRIKNGHFSYDGIDYQVPLNFGEHPHSIHGVGWQSLWNLKQQSESSVTITLDYAGPGWPHAFSATQTIALDGKTLTHKISLSNTSDTAFPAGLGMHPYFPRHGGAILQADVDSVWLNDETCMPIELAPISNHNDTDHWNLSEGSAVETLLCDNLFQTWSRKAHISWPNDGVSVDLTASNDLDRLMVYAPEGENFFCVEPVSHITDAFNLSDQGMSKGDSGSKTLAPGENWTVWMKLTPT